MLDNIYCICIYTVGAGLCCCCIYAVGAGLCCCIYAVGAGLCCIYAVGAELYCYISVYIQLSEKQQLGLDRRFLKYLEIQGEREKMANQRNFSLGCNGGIHHCRQMKKKNGTIRNIICLLSSLNAVLSWRKEVFHLARSRFCY